MDKFEGGLAELMDFGRGFWTSSVLLAAVRTGVTGELAKGPAEASELTQRLGLSSRGLDILLTAMKAMGLCQDQDGVFSLAPGLDQLLDPQSPAGLHNYLMHNTYLMQTWSRLDESITSGQPIPKPPAPPDGELPPPRRYFYLGMRDLGRLGAPGLAARLGISPDWRLLDLGGGPGVYALTMAAETPGLKATVFDFPASRQFFQEESQGHPAADRVDFQEGNFLNDDLGGPYDAVLASNILHTMGPDDFQKLMIKVAKALTPGGRIWIQDFFLDAPGRAGRFAALFALNMLVNTTVGRTYSSTEVGGMLRSAGFDDIEFLGVTQAKDLASMLAARLRS
jgi:SAM-dependent methyltransferase